MNKRFLASVAALLLLHPISHAYELQTHQLLSTYAAGRSVLAQSSFLKSIGIDQPIDTQKYPDSTQQPQSILNLIGQGAEFEDTLSATRVRHHFFNPVDNKGLNRYFTSMGTPSPSWALEDDGQKDVALEGEQKYSYRDARGYYLEALTNPAQVTRDQRFGAVFESLGHVVHHLQDMTQPAHARNDVHLNFNDVFDTVSVNDWLNRHIGNPSQLELWAEERENREGLPLDPTQVGYDIDGADFKRIFSSPRKFWKTDYLSGIAEYANRGFVSPGTNFTGNPTSGVQSSSKFQYPNGDAIEIEKLPINDPSLLGEGADRMGLKGQVQFIKKPVADFFTGTSSEKIRLSAYSIFTEDFAVAKNKYTFTTNRFVYKDITSQLIPRAVAFSAGMINYFFRGKIDMEKATDIEGGYLIRNKGIEPMTGRFALYYDDAANNRWQVKNEAGQPIEWNSETYAGGALAPGASMRVPEFPVQANPEAKVAGEFMLVFNGDMGEETRAMFGVGAVAAVKIGTGALLITSVQANSNRYLVHRSKDLGQTWEPAGSFPGSYGGHITAIGPDTVLAGQALSTDSGVSWQSLPSSTYANRLRISAAPQGGTNLLGTRMEGEPQVAFSTDNGASWGAGQTIPGLKLNIFQPTAMGNNRFVVKSFYPSGSSCAGNSCTFSYTAGLYSSADSGASWSLITDVGVESMDDQIIYLGKNKVVGGALIPDKNGVDTLFAIRYIRLSSGDFRPEFVRSLDGGATWAATGFPAEMATYGEPDFHTLWHLVSAGNGTILAYFHDSGGYPQKQYLYKSTDNGLTWALAGDLPDGTVNPGLYGMAFVRRF